MSTKKNYFYNVLCELITTLIPLITTPHVTRILGRGGMGSYAYVTTVASYFVLFANFGVKTYGNRCIASAGEDREARSRVFSGIYCQQLILSFGVSLLYLLYSLAFGGVYLPLFAVFGINMLSAILEITWLYYGTEHFKGPALCTIVTKVAVAVGIFTLVRDEGDLVLYALLCSLGVIAVQLYLWCGVRRYVHFVRVPFSEVKRHFLPSLALLIPMLAPTLYRSMDKFMLEAFLGKESVGLYSTAEQLQTCMLGFITGLGVVMLSRISHLLADGKKADADKCIGYSMQFSTFMGSAFAFGIASVSSVFVPYYYGAAFAESALPTAVLAPTILFISWAEVIRSQYIIPHKRDRIFILSVLAGGIVNLGCNAVLIPLFSKNAALFGLSADGAGTLGALPGTLAAELAVILVQFLFLRRELPFGQYLRQCILFPCAGILMFLAVRGIGVLLSGHLSPMPLLVLQVLCGGGLYLAVVLVWYLLFRRETLHLLFKK